MYLFLFQVSFTVEYTMFETEQLRNFQIAVGVLSTLAFLHAAFRTWVWSKRAGRIAIDFLSLINFVFLVAGSLANIFFVVIFGSAFYYLVFFKVNQTVGLSCQISTCSFEVCESVHSGLCTCGMLCLWM